MKIENQIKALLLQHDCVIVPSFGAFLAQKKSAMLNASNNEFRPPYKEISFNASLKNNDGLLVNHIQQTTQWSYDQAMEMIQNQVKFWREHLFAGKELDLNGIGTIKLNDVNALEFIPNQENFLLSSYGLPVVKANYILEHEISETSSTRKYSGLLAAASILPILIGGFLYFNTPQPVKTFVDEQWSGIVLPMIGKEKVATVEAEQKTALIDHLPQLKTSVKSETNKTQTFVVNTAQATKHYQVVAGSFKRLEEAELAIQNLKNQGYSQAGMVYKKGSYFYVNYNAFDNEAEARAFLNKIHEHDKAAWIRTN
ncbi:SPOR domain-containing protein [Vaginella massiliensis]|uniref:HU domain-containing protein n=1 Tax=Vaginella massiliensis TaxID=1816680 RepID=UPI00375348B3